MDLPKTAQMPTRVLCIEDDKGLARLFQRKLEREGFEVLVAGSAERGLELCDAESPDVVAVDYELPDLSGLEVLRRLLEQGARAPSAIFVTGAGDERVAVEAVQLGALAYLIKDAEGAYLELLPAAIQRVLDQARLLEEKRRSELALSRSEASLNEAQRIARLGNWDWDIENNRLHCSQEVCRILGLDPVSKLTRNDIFEAAVHPEDREKVKRAVSAALKATGRFGMDHRLLLPNGDVRIVHHQAEMTRDAQGLAKRMVGTLQDVTASKQTEAALRRRLELERIVTTLSTELINLSADEVDKIIVDALGQIGRFVGADRGCILHRSLSGQGFRNTHQWCALGLAPHPETMQDKLPEALALWHESIGQSELIDIPQVSDLPSEPAALKRTLRALGIKSLAVVPLSYAADRPGFLEFETVNQPRQWSTEDFSALRLAGDMLTSALQRKAHEQALEETQSELRQANAQLERLVRLDGLTGISNRRHFDDRLDQELRRAARDHSPLALILCDVDCFKAYNDTYGHVAGDGCLKQIAATLAGDFERAADLPARFGGEEFAVILPGSDEAEVARSAEMVRSEVWNLNIPHSHSSVADRVTVSVGVAVTRPAPDDRLEALVDKADKALYLSKQSGRNRVTVYPTHSDQRADADGNTS
jgi:diguanylate cyclase (GGDEF)-like protein/PAS domain S-box-containing protein